MLYIHFKQYIFALCYRGKMIQYIYNILIVGEKMHQTLNFKSKSVELILEKNCFQTIKNYCN